MSDQTYEQDLARLRESLEIYVENGQMVVSAQVPLKSVYTSDADEEPSDPLYARACKDLNDPDLAKTRAAGVTKLVIKRP